MIGEHLRRLLKRFTNDRFDYRPKRLFTGSSGQDRAAVNLVVEYVFALGIFILLTGLLISGFSSTISTTQENVAQVQIEQASTEIAVAIEDVDRMVSEEGATEAQIQIELPDTAGSEAYFIRVGDGTVIAETGIASSGNASTEVEYNSENPVEGVEGVSGGDIVVSYDGESESGEIQVRSR